MSLSSHPGPLRALMAVYHDAADALTQFIASVDDAVYERGRNGDAAPGDLGSIHGIVEHVAYSGYHYADDIGAALGVASESYTAAHADRAVAMAEIAAMLGYTERVLDGHWDEPEEFVDRVKMETPWNVTYSLEQMLEHAIVHILRHLKSAERLARMNDEV